LINTKIKYIFLSNNTIHHVGGLPYLLKGDRFKDTEIYTTTPISKLGFYIILDAVISKLDVEEFLHFNDTDITEAFLRLKELNYDQKVKLNHNHTEILISPVSSGYSIGGCAWKIIYNRKTIIYAPQISIDSKK
jgi:Cft2 family RNA processing exonuclease